MRMKQEHRVYLEKTVNGAIKEGEMEVLAHFCADRYRKDCNQLVNVVLQVSQSQCTLLSP